MRLLAALACCSGMAATPAQSGQSGAPVAELGKAVAAATPALRRAAAEALAKVPGVGVEQWLQACAHFGEFAALAPGPDRQQVDLQVLDAVERTELCLYVPPHYDAGKPAPLLLALHGTGGDGAREFLRWQTVADQLSMLVLAPSEAGDNSGYHHAARERAAALAALRWARRTANVDDNRVFVTGISRGGHLTWDLVLRWPDLFAAAVPCIGGPWLQWNDGNNNLRYLENVTALPIRDLQGAQDHPRMVGDLRLAFAQLKKLGAADAQLIEFKDLGHDFDLGAVDFDAWFARTVRTPVPKVVVRMAADLREARTFWAEILATDDKVVLGFVPQVSPALWSAMDEQKQREYVHAHMVEHTGRLKVTMTESGRFSVEAAGVRKFRLLLLREMLGKDGSVEVRWAGKTYKHKPTADAAVLLREFVERCDRTFLPVAEVVVP